jgi:metal-sulfur cluster biosynthetic enzyme
MSSKPSVAGQRDALRAVVDPEHGVNIVDIGLVYDILVAESLACVTMTLTSPACPMGDIILHEVGVTLRKQLPQGYELDIKVVWEPPWDPKMMNDNARAHFGWLQHKAIRARS